MEEIEIVKPVKVKHNNKQKTHYPNKGIVQKSAVVLDNLTEEEKVTAILRNLK